MSATESQRSAVRVRFLPADTTVQVPRGAYLSLAAIRARAPIVHDCDGLGLCGTCRVRVQSGAGGLSPLEPVERRQLGPDAELGWRLCCRARVFGDVVLRAEERGFAYPPELQR